MCKVSGIQLNPRDLPWSCSFLGSAACLLCVQLLPLLPNCSLFLGLVFKLPKREALIGPNLVTTVLVGQNSHPAFHHRVLASLWRDCSGIRCPLLAQSALARGKQDHVVPNIATYS
jgi:hypothetical protein